MLGCLLLSYTENLDKITSLERRLQREGNKGKTMLRCKIAIERLSLTLRGLTSNGKRQR